MHVTEEAIRALIPITDALGLANPEFDEALRFTMIVNESQPTIFEIDEAERRLLVNVVLGPVPDHGIEQVLYLLMTANYLRLGTDGGTFGIDSESKMITVCDFIDLPVQEPHLLRERLESLLSIAAEYVQELLEIEAATTQSSDEIGTRTGAQPLRV